MTNEQKQRLIDAHCDWTEKAEWARATAAWSSLSDEWESARADAHSAAIRYLEVLNNLT